MHGYTPLGSGKKKVEQQHNDADEEEEPNIDIDKN